VNNTAKTVDKTVPAGKKWFLHALGCQNGDSVNRALQVKILDASGNEVDRLVDVTNTAGQILFLPRPYQGESQATCLSNWWMGGVPLPEGWTVRFVWATGGVSAGGTGFASIMREEIDV
jgi:hypothetical protein